MTNRRGFALATTLWVLALVAVLVMVALADARGAYGATRNRLLAERAYWAAEDCVARGRAALDHALAGADSAGELVDRWVWLDGASSLEVTPELGCSLSLIPAGATLDVNAAGEVELTRFFAQSHGPADAHALAAAVLDWRDADDSVSADGAERDAYRSARRLPPDNRPFASPRELADVRGMRGPEDWAGLGVDGVAVDLHHAPALVLQALPGVSAELADRIVDRRKDRRRIPSLLFLVDGLSPEARDTMMSSYPQLERSVALVPEAWFLTGTSTVQGLSCEVRVRLILATGRAAVAAREVLC